MKYSSFEELPVWKAAIEFALETFKLTDRADFRGLGDTKNQLERAALSVSNNIAEGFERGTTNELITFLYISKGSCGESRSILRLCERVPKFANFRSEISNLINRATNVSKQLNGWIESLKNSEIKGMRYLNDKDRRRIERNKEFADFDAQMARFRVELEEKLKRQEQENWLRREASGEEI
jgi:four helix bundle protein